MDPLRRLIRRAFNKVDPAHLFELSGDPEEYAAEVDWLVTRFRTNPPNDPEAVVRQVHKALRLMLRGGGGFAVVLLPDDIDNTLRYFHSEGHLNSSPTREEIRVGQMIWSKMNGE